MTRQRSKWLEWRGNTSVTRYGDWQLQESWLWYVSGLCDTINHWLTGSEAMEISLLRTRNYGRGLTTVWGPDNAYNSFAFKRASPTSNVKLGYVPWADYIVDIWAVKLPKRNSKSTKSEVFEPPMQANTLVLHPWRLGFFPYVFCIDV